MKAPGLRPVILLFVLADLDHDEVTACFQNAAADVLVHAVAVVVFLAREQQLVVEEDLDRIVAADADFDRPLDPGPPKMTSPSFNLISSTAPESGMKLSCMALTAPSEEAVDTMANSAMSNARRILMAPLCRHVASWLAFLCIHHLL